MRLRRHASVRTDIFQQIAIEFDYGSGTALPEWSRLPLGYSGDKIAWDTISINFQ